MEPVSIVRCPEYGLPLLKNTFQESVRLIGFNLSFFKNKTVLLKPNLLSPAAPEKAVTTHPHFIRAAVEMVLDAGGKALVGDSPGMGMTTMVMKRCGVTEALKGLPVRFCAFNRPVEQRNPSGGVRKKFMVAAEALECDCILNLPKLKTHGQMGLTGAAKNLFGLVPGLTKAKTHMEAGRDEGLFARTLLELCYLNKPALSLVDGILAMEGNGPGSGDPRRLGLVLAGTDPVAVDSVIADITGFDKKALPMLLAAEQWGFGVPQADKIRIAGVPLADARVPDFKAASGGRPLRMLPEFIVNHFRNLVSLKPVVDRKKCLLCGECLTVCPAGAMREKEGKILINQELCIRCFCCQELCPHGAISPQRGALGRAVYSTGKFIFRR